MSLFHGYAETARRFFYPALLVFGTGFMLDSCQSNIDRMLNNDNNQIGATSGTSAGFGTGASLPTQGQTPTVIQPPSVTAVTPLSGVVGSLQEFVITGAHFPQSLDVSLGAASCSQHTWVSAQEFRISCQYAQAGTLNMEIKSNGQVLKTQAIRFVLPAPSNLNVVESGSKLKFTWTASVGADKYNLYYAEQSFAGISNVANYASLTGGVMVADISGTQKELDVVTFKGNTTYYFVVTAKSGTEESGVSDEKSTQVTSSLLNDTGITKCVDASKVAKDCAIAVFKGQDGHYGTGKGGSKGMVFTKVAGFLGKCVQDEHTGLMWEVKQLSGLHSNVHTYTWYNPDNTINGGNAGAKGDGTSCSSSLTECNTQAFVAAVNSVGWCGHHDWRLPTAEELRSIVDYGRANLRIDADYFPNTFPSSSVGKKNYWSSMPTQTLKTAWGMDFGTGIKKGIEKSNPYFVRLVRIR